jgi:Fic family protein
MSGIPVVHAVDDPQLDKDLITSACESIVARGVERAVARWRERLANLVWNDAALEGNTFTLPEVATLLDGGAVRSHSAMDAEQVLDLSAAANEVLERSLSGVTEVSIELSNELNALITAHEVMEPGIIRGDGTVGGEAAVNAMGTKFIAPASDGNLLRRLFEQDRQECEMFDHPVAQGAVWAAFAAYHQFYSNGNKRTARYVMNAVLMSQGFDAISTPVSQRDRYNVTLRDMYLSGDLTGYALFLVSLYDDSHA